MKHFVYLAIPAGVLAVVLSLGATGWFAQPVAAAQAQTSPQRSETPPEPGMGRMGIMMGRHMGGWMGCCPCWGHGGMMGGPMMRGPMMHGPMMGGPMMGGPMMGEWAAKNPKLAGKMMEMRAEMMQMRAEMIKAQAGIMQKYAKQLEAGK